MRRGSWGEERGWEALSVVQTLGNQKEARYAPGSADFVDEGGQP